MPVDAPILEAFGNPTRFGPGNRGIDFDVVPGLAVAAVAAGTVTFAGSVAGELFVTVQHADGRRASYSYLLVIAVERGDVVDVGTVLGSTSGRFQLGLRDGDRYLDPAGLIRRGRRHAVLVR